MSHYPEDYKREGNSIRPKWNRSISIREGYCGYKDFGTEETGNSIDYLTRHCGYTFNQAVSALITGADVVKQDPKRTDEPKQVVFPRRAENNDRAIGYLRFRGIPGDTIDMLINRGLIYQAEEHSNIVFINKERDCAEVRATILADHKLFPRCYKPTADRFWWFD